MTPRQLIEPARLAGNALLHTQSDARLVDLARAGNDRAFEVIVGRYRGPLLRYCERLLPAGRAEDAVQQAFLNAYRAIGRNEAELNLKPWLYRVAHNAALNLLRQNGWNYDEIPEDFDGVVQPPQALEQREQIRQLVESVQELPERQRNAIVLRELEGRSYEEIAAALGVTDGAVRQLLNRARGTLRSAATALTPPRILESLFDRASSPGAAQIAEVSAGAGGAAGVVKLGAALVVAGAVGGAVVAGPAHHLVLGGPSRGGRAQDALAAAGGGAGGGGSFGGATALGIGTGPGHGEGTGSGFAAAAPTSSSGTAGSGGPGGGGSSSTSHSGPGGGGGFVDFNPGSGGPGPSGGDGGGHGSGDGGGDHGSSGPGDGGHSGSGSGDGGHGSSDGGSSGTSDGGSSGSSRDGGSSGSGDGSSGFGSGVPTIGSSGSGDGGSGSGGGAVSGSGDGGISGSSDGGISGSGSGSDGGSDHSGPGG